MRAISPPPNSPRDVYITCAQTISCADVRRKLISQATIIESIANDYSNKAQTQDLYLILANECSNDEAVLGNVTKKELKALYSTQMLNNQAPRAIYDSILAQAPLGKCPFCGIGHASTLDHFLPKALFPQLAVIPINLVPSCKDCNHGKSTAVATTREAQGLHPYYDHGHYIHEQWLRAEIVPTSPETVSFSATPPDDWNRISKHRIQAHFTDFKLKERYSIEAASEIAEKADQFDYFLQNLGLEALVGLLKSEADSRYSNNPNSWQTALYQALLKKYEDLQQQHNSADDNSYNSSLQTCRRCSGKGELLGESCDICNGMGAATTSFFETLNEEVIFAPVSCPSCIVGNPDCRICRGQGSIRWDRARDINNDFLTNET